MRESALLIIKIIFIVSFVHIYLMWFIFCFEISYKKGRHDQAVDIYLDAYSVKGEAHE